MTNARKGNFRAHLIGSTAILALCAGAANAQENNDIEQVVVSASRVSIAGYSQPTPVTVVGTAQLEQDAYANIADAVRNLPELTSPPSSYSTSPAQAASNSAGANFMNLRDLGPGRTLTLFDGQRVVSTTLLAGSVDVNTLPSPIVQRIDVVTGGASAAWGSDAVAGVVNFVVNKNFSGFKANFEGSDTTAGLYPQINGNAVWGEDIAGGRGHIEFAASARLIPQAVLVTQENWFKGAYWVSNPAYAAGNGQPQLISVPNVGFANATVGGLIISSPAGVAGPGVAPAAVNALRGIEFVGGGTPQLVNFGNVTLGTLSNGGSLTETNTSTPYSLIGTPNNTYTFFGYGRYKLTDTIQLSAQVNYSYFTGRSPAASSVQNALVIKSDNAYLPASVQSAMQNGGITSFTLGTFNTTNYVNSGATGANYFTQAEQSDGPGYALNHRNLVRGVLTLDGTLGNDWSWTTYIQHSEVRNTAHLYNFPILANLSAAQDAVTVTTANRGKSTAPVGSIACRSTLTGAAVTVSGYTAPAGCVPLDIFGMGVASQAAIAYVDGSSTNTTDYSHQSLTQEVAEGSMQGTLPWELPAGKVAVAFGMGYRKEGGRLVASPLGATAAYGTGNFSPFPSRDYNVIEGFAEVDAPILKNKIVNSLDITMAGRMTSYSTSGLVETWKLGATSQVIDDVKLRTTWSVDIRAPQLNDLFSAATVAQQNQRDPKTQSTVGANTVTAGNPNLVPEVARTISGGAVLTPTFIPGLTLSADWYSINLTSEIATIAPATIVNQCNPTLASVIYPGTQGNPNDPLCAALVFGGPSGALSAVNNTQINIASQTVSGLDIQATYAMDFWDGSLTWSTVDNYTDENTINNPGTGKNDYAGADNMASTPAGSVAPGPKWKGIVSATYAGGPYSFTVQSRWFGTSVDQQNGNTGNLATASTALLYDPAHFEAPFVAYLDLRGSYKWNDNISFYGAIDNALHTPPAFLTPTSTSTQPSSNESYNTNQYVYDMLGRTFRVGVRLNY